MIHNTKSITVHMNPTMTTNVTPALLILTLELSRVLKIKNIIEYE